MKKSNWLVTIVLALTCVFISNGFVLRANETVVNGSEKHDITCFVKYINSQDPLGKDALNFIQEPEKGVYIKNDGGYVFGKPGVYQITYGIENTNIEKTFPITVIKSKGTAIDMEYLGGNTKVVNSGELENLDNWVKNSVVSRTKIQTVDGNYVYIDSKVKNAASGGGGGEGICLSSYVPLFSWNYENPTLVYQDAKMAEYYIPNVNTDNVLEKQYYLVDKEYLKDAVLENKDFGITLKGNLPDIEGFEYSLESQNVTDSITKLVGTNQQVAYQMAVKENTFGLAPTTKGEYVVTIKVPSNLSINKISVYSIGFDGTKKLLTSTIEGDSIACKVDLVPTTIILVEDKTIPDTPNSSKPTILEGENSVWKQGSNESLVIRSSADFETFKGVSVDGKMIDASNYTVKKGSIIVALQPAYLSTLANGKHTVTILSSQGDVATNFEVSQVSIDVEKDKNNNVANLPSNKNQAKESNKRKTIVNTGDYANIEMIAAIGIAFAICGLKIYKRKDA